VAGSIFSRDPALLARYERDVSPLSQTPSGVLLARDIADVVAAVDEARGQCIGLLAVGGQTSTTGASVASPGNVVVDVTALERQPQLDAASHRVVVGPGTRLGALRSWLHGRGFDLPVDPTSQHECTVGGAIATNASGPGTYAHGAMRDWVVGAELVDGRSHRHVWHRRQVAKCALGPAGLQDPIDFIVGSEGLYGVIVEATLAVRRRPETTIGIWVPLPSRDDVFTATGSVVEASESTIRAIEWLDGRCCALLEGQGDMPLDPVAGGGLYIEFEGKRAQTETAIERIAATCVAHGARMDGIEFYGTDADRAEFAKRRHGVPDQLNRRGRTWAEQGGGKLSTDWSIPLAALPGLFAWTDVRLAALELEGWFAFGHIGNGHPHLNLLTRTQHERATATEALGEQLARVVAAGGVPVSEHGIGKLKRRLVQPYLTAATVAAIRALKTHFDPGGVLARGNIIDA